MYIMLPAADASAAPLPLDREPAAPSAAILAAANLLLPHLERGQPVDTGMLRVAMETTFGASDASGVWDWKEAYEAGEIATVLFLRKYGKTLFRKAGQPALRLSALIKIAALLPTHTRRSEESQALQLQIPTFIRPGFRFASGHHSKVKPATIPINIRPPEGV